MAKPKEKIEARRLRTEGRSIKSIAKELNVSPDSVSRWCRDVKLTKEQVEQLERNAHDPRYGRRLENSLRQQQVRMEKVSRLMEEGINDVGSVFDRELFLVGVALYWAEGFKKDSQAGLASSDPEMIKLFVRWLRECFGYTFEDLSLRVTANVSHQYRISEIEKFWSDVLGISLNNFQKPFFQKVKWKKVYENHDTYHGVLRVRVRRSTDFLRKVHGFIEGLRLNSSVN